VIRRRTAARDWALRAHRKKDPTETASCVLESFAHRESGDLARLRLADEKQPSSAALNTDGYRDRLLWQLPARGPLADEWVPA